MDSECNIRLKLKFAARRRRMAFCTRQRRQRRQFFALLMTIITTVYLPVSRNRRVWQVHRSTQWWYTIANEWDDETWRNNFRVSRQTFTYICDQLRGKLQKVNTVMREAVETERRVAIALWRLATNTEYRTLGHMFGVARSTVCRIVNEVCEAIRDVLMPIHLKFPKGDQVMEIVNGFEVRWGFPQCCGAIDGTHIPIIAPYIQPVDYYNRKGYHSYNMQGLVDSKYRFIDISIECPGSVHDARAFSLSPLCILGERGRLLPNMRRNINGVDIPLILIGDSAYPLLNWLMKPFSDNGLLTAEQKMFNYRLSRARMVVENAYGRLKGRWRILLKRLDNDFLKVPSLVAACCVLHNICETFGEVPFILENIDEHVELIQQPDQPVNEAQTASANEIRDTLVNYFAN